MTMGEINRRREVAKVAINLLRTAESAIEPCYECGSHQPLINSTEEGELLDRRDDVRKAENAVLSALQEWWAQECKEAPEPTPEPLQCVCTYFDDESSFMLGSFAGGAAEEGEFSFVTCLHTRKDGTTEIMHYRRVP